MKLFFLTILFLCALLNLSNASSESQEESFDEVFEVKETERACATPEQSCSKGRYGSGPSCCPPKGCSCNPFTRNCHCRWDSVSHTAGEAWDWLTSPFGK